MTGERRTSPLRAPLLALLGLASVALSACEDRGNPGNDNLLTGGSLVLVIIIVIVVLVFIVRRRR